MKIRHLTSIRKSLFIPGMLKSNSMSTVSAAHLPVHERIILLIDRYPLSALYRIGLGYGFPLLYYRISSKESSEWLVVLWFLSCLLGLRIFPAISRKVLPFSRDVKQIWVERREMAKRYDSYQWRKLIWFGIGLTGYVASSGIWNEPVCTLAVFCLVAGGVGTLFWRKRVVEENVVIA